MAYGVMLIISWILIGSGVIGSDAFLIGLVLSSLFVCIGLAVFFSAADDKEDDK